jgi:hypothetical protein
VAGCGWIRLLHTGRLRELDDFTSMAIGYLLLGVGLSWY